jgi:hypothetical protein
MKNDILSMLLNTRILWLKHRKSSQLPIDWAIHFPYRVDEKGEKFSSKPIQINYVDMFP